MQPSQQTNGGSNSSHWLDIMETFAVVSTIGGTVAAAVSQQIAMAAIPLSLTATINLANRRRQMGELLRQQRIESSHLVEQSNTSLRADLSEAQQSSTKLQSQIDQLLEQDTQILETLESLTSRATKLGEEISTLNQHQDQHQSSLTELCAQQQSTVAQCDDLSSQLEDLQNVLSRLQSSTLDLSNQVETQHNSSQLLAAQTENVEELLETLREIDTITQAISAQPNFAENFYQRGLIRKRLQRMEDQQTTLDDFSKAIQLEPTHAKAYFERGVLQAELDQKQRAIDDLHSAAKLFFGAGQLDQYEKARELSKKLHDLMTRASTEEDANDPILVENLFS